MKELKGNIWESGADVICVTTNGIVKSDGNAVMGAGIAKQAAEFYPPLPKYLANCILKHGNHVFIFPLTSDVITNEPCIVTFPTKHDWRKDSFIELILQSCIELRTLANNHQWKRIALPRVGCGRGGLVWSDVRHEIKQYLSDDRFEIWER
jgi:hypothetical protein